MVVIRPSHHRRYHLLTGPKFEIETVKEVLERCIIVRRISKSKEIFYPHGPPKSSRHQSTFRKSVTDMCRSRVIHLHMYVLYLQWKSTPGWCTSVTWSGTSVWSFNNLISLRNIRDLSISFSTFIPLGFIHVRIKSSSSFGLIPVCRSTVIYS